MRMRGWLLGVAVLLAGCHDRSFGERLCDAAPEATTLTLSQLCAAFEGATTEITSDIVVGGRVTTSDEAENFYRTFCIEEEGAAIEIMAGVDHLHNDFPKGTYVTLRLKGYALGRHYGVLQMGRKPAPGSSYTTDYIASSRAALDKALTRTSLAVAVPQPTPRTIAELTPAVCGTLVRIDGVRYAPEGLAEGTTWAGYKRFVDDTGAAIHTYVRAYARFAGEEVPLGRCMLQGILQLDGGSSGRYILKLRDENDCEVR